MFYQFLLSNLIFNFTMLQNLNDVIFLYSDKLAWITFAGIYTLV